MFSASAFALEEPPHPWLQSSCSCGFPRKPLQSRTNSLQLCFALSSIGFCCLPTGLPVGVCSLVTRVWSDGEDQCQGLPEGWYPWSLSVRLVPRVSQGLNKIMHMWWWIEWAGLAGEKQSHVILTHHCFLHEFFWLFLPCPWEIPQMFGYSQIF